MRIPRVGHCLQREIDSGNPYFRGSHITGNAVIKLPKGEVTPILCFREVHCSGNLTIIGGMVQVICIEGAKIEGEFVYAETNIGQIDFDGQTRVNGEPFVPRPGVKAVLKTPPEVLPAERSAIRQPVEAGATA